jgi:hypothetical protein
MGTAGKARLQCSDHELRSPAAEWKVLPFFWAFDSPWCFQGSSETVQF